MNSLFDYAFKNILKYEGGYTNDPNDRGNWTSGIVGKGECKGTKYGISAMAYPNLDIKNLSEGQAKEIYYKDYWVKIGLENLNPKLAMQIFDAAIQHGPSTAIKLLQKLLSLKDTGVIDNTLIDTIKFENQETLIFQYIAKRLEYYTSIKTFSLYGKGWVNRMAANLNEAALLCERRTI